MVLIFWVAGVRCRSGTNTTVSFPLGGCGPCKLAGPAGHGVHPRRAGGDHLSRARVQRSLDVDAPVFPVGAADDLVGVALRTGTLSSAPAGMRVTSVYCGLAASRSATITGLPARPCSSTMSESVPPGLSVTVWVSSWFTKAEDGQVGPGKAFALAALALEGSCR